MKKPKILYHGSDKKIKKLVPRKPSKDLPENSSMKAIFATDDKNRALGMTLVHGKGLVTFRGSKKMNFVKGKPQKKYGYLHYLSSETFVENRPGEFVSYVAVKPIKIEKHKVSELGHLWRKSNKEELKEFLKDRAKWRRENREK